MNPNIVNITYLDLERQHLNKKHILGTFLIKSDNSVTPHVCDWFSLLTLYINNAL